MEQNFGLDLDEVCNVIDTADVIIIRFRIIEQRLLIDSRHNESTGPIIQLVRRAQSVEDRFHSLKELRPGFPLPDRIMSFEWPKHVSILTTAGIWGRIEARLQREGGDSARDEARAIYEQLLAAERSEEVEAIRGGDGYQTLWQRSS